MATGISWGMGLDNYFSQRCVYATTWEHLNVGKKPVVESNRGTDTDCDSVAIGRLLSWHLGSQGH